MVEKSSLFSISCETCTARLTVRDQNAIGQVLACPRCGSMVMVEPPEGWTAPVRQVPPRRPRDPNDSQATLSGEFGDLTSASPATSAVGTRQPIQSRSPQGAPQPVLPDGNWESEASRNRRRQVAWIAGAAGASLIALIAIVWMISSLTGGGTPVAEAAPGEENTIAADNESRQAKDPDAKQPGHPDAGLPATNETGPDTETDTRANGGDAGDSGGGADPEVESGAAAEGQDADSSGPGPDSAESDSGTPIPLHPDRSLPDTVDVAGSGDGAVKPDEPLIDIDGSLTGNSEGITIDDQGSGKTLTEDIGDMADLFTDPGVDLEAMRDIAVDARPVGIGEVFILRPKPLTLDFQKQLNEPFPGVSYEDVALSGFLGNLTVLTGIPIMIDGHSVLYGHIDPRAQVSFQGTDKTVLEMINDATVGMNLVAIPLPEQQLIVLTDTQQQVFANRTLDLDPALLGNEEQNTRLVNLVHTVTGPELWNLNGGQSRIEIRDGQAVIESDGRLADEVTWLLDRLGVAARQATDQADLPDQTKARSLWSAAREILDAPDAFEQEQFEPVDRILRQVQQHDGLVVLVDWNAIMPRWNPRLMLPWPSRDLTVGETLKDIASSMALKTRILTPEVVEITSPDRYWDASRIEVFPCRKQLDKFTSEQIMGYLRASVMSDLRDGSWKRVEFDPGLKCVVARLPDPLLIRVEQTLQELGRD